MLFNSFKMAFSMYSKIPMPKTEWTKENMKYTLCFFPVVGIVIGISIYFSIQWGLSLSLSPLFFSALMTLIPIFFTGGIHFDGFLDTVDALSSYGNREKKLQILKDPHTGAFAILACACYFILNLGIWSEATSDISIIIMLSYILSRALSGLSVVTFPLAKESGLAATFSNSAHKKKVCITMISYIFFCCALMLYFHFLLGLACILTAFVTFLFYWHICKKHFGGVTGDLAGFFLQTCELAMLISVIITNKVVM